MKGRFLQSSHSFRFALSCAAPTLAPPRRQPLSHSQRATSCSTPVADSTGGRRPARQRQRAPTDGSTTAGRSASVATLPSPLSEACTRSWMAVDRAAANGDAAGALRLYLEARAAGCEQPKTGLYARIFTACARSGRWRQACALADDATAGNVVLNAQASLLSVRHLPPRPRFCLCEFMVSPFHCVSGWCASGAYLACRLISARRQ